MVHVLPFYLFFCLMCGLGSLLVLAVALKRSGERLLFWLIAFILGMGVAVFSNLLIFYSAINLSRDITRAFYLQMLVAAPFSGLLFASGPIFLHGFLDVPWKRVGNAAVAAAAACAAVVAPLAASYVPGEGRLSYPRGGVLVDVVHLCLILYSLGMAVAFRGRVADGRKRKLLDRFLILTVLFLPGFAHDLFYFAARGGMDRLPATFVFFPLYFCAVAGGSAYVGLAWLIRGRLAAAAPKAPASPSRPDLPGLSERELEIVGLVLGGLGNKQIAARLGLSVKTVNNHLYSLYQKLGINSRWELIARVHGPGARGSTA